jgi:hypothetical protein
MKIEIDGQSYKVNDCINPSASYPYKVAFVQTDSGERVAVRRNGTWRWRDNMEKVESLVKFHKDQTQVKD